MVCGWPGRRSFTLRSAAQKSTRSVRTQDTAVQDRRHCNAAVSFTLHTVVWAWGLLHFFLSWFLAARQIYDPLYDALLPLSDSFQ